MISWKIILDLYDKLENKMRHVIIYSSSHSIFMNRCPSFSKILVKKNSCSTPKEIFSMKNVKK